MAEAKLSKKDIERLRENGVLRKGTENLTVNPSYQDVFSVNEDGHLEGDGRTTEWQENITQEQEAKRERSWERYNNIINKSLMTGSVEETKKGLKAMLKANEIEDEIFNEEVKNNKYKESDKLREKYQETVQQLTNCEFNSLYEREKLDQKAMALRSILEDRNEQIDETNEKE